MKPTAELTAARDAMNQLFGKAYPFAPHLSLMYGDWSTEDRQMALRAIGGSNALAGKPFPVTRLLLVDCNGKEHSVWPVLHEAKLANAK